MCDSARWSVSFHHLARVCVCVCAFIWWGEHSSPSFTCSVCECINQSERGTSDILYTHYSKHIRTHGPGTTGMPAPFICISRPRVSLFSSFYLCHISLMSRRHELGCLSPHVDALQALSFSFFSLSLVFPMQSASLMINPLHILISVHFVPHFPARFFLPNRNPNSRLSGTIRTTLPRRTREQTLLMCGYMHMLVHASEQGDLTPLT